MNSPVLFDELVTADGRKVGLATLNSPQTLNGLSLDMYKLLAAQLRQWEDDTQIAMVVLRGAGDRAFCAGGDLHGIYKGMQDNSSGQAWDNTYAREFFDVEYRLDHHIHTYSKPLLCWGNGIVRSEEHTSELQSLMRISYAVFCLKKKKTYSHKQQ